jgi:hypothetical protein
MNRRLKNFLKERVLHSFFRAGQRLGFDLLPRHFYSEIPNLRTLAATEDWKRPHTPPVCGWQDLDGQLEFARTALGNCTQDVEAFYASACGEAGEVGFGPVEAAALWSFVTIRKPPAVLQIGCGMSTAIVLLAAKAAEYRPDVTCVEPYPSDFLRKCEEEGRIRLVGKPAQEIVAELGERVDALPAGSLFFVDSSHTLGPAGECTWLVCEVLPRLRADRYAHFHDVWFPYDYPPDLLDKSLFFWHETALLMAFLSCNSRFRIAASLAMLHYGRPRELGELFRGYRPRANDEGLGLGEGHFPSSCYLLCTADAGGPSQARAARW